MFLPRLSVAILAACSLLAAQESTPADKTKPKGTVSGAITDALTGRPLKKAVVTLRRSDAGPRERFQQPVMTSTGIDGKYSISVDAGEYRLVVNRNGYVRQAYGQKDTRRPGAVLTVAAGENVNNIDFKLVPGGVISGRVVDEDGEPLSNVTVQALRPTYRDGERRFEPAGTARTDDRGEYRVFGLLPKRYYLSATRRGMEFVGVVEDAANGAPPAEGYGTMYYPGTPDSNSASPIEVRTGEEQRANFNLIPSRIFKVSGRVTDSSGHPLSTGFATLMPRSGGFMIAPGAFSPVQDGRFEIRSVVPGSYFLVVGSRDDSVEAARRDLDVSDDDVTNIALVTSPGREVMGQIRYADLATKPAESNVFLRPRRSAMFFGMASATAKADGNFTLKNVFPEDYVVTVPTLPPDAYVKSVRVGGEEVLISGFNGARAGNMEIVVSGRAGRIEGAVHDAVGNPVMGATVVLHSDVPNLNRRGGGPQTASTDRNGHYSFRGLRPANYQIAAWQEIEEEEYLDPEFPTRHQGKLTAIRLSEGDVRNQDLTLQTSAGDSVGR